MRHAHVLLSAALLLVATPVPVRGQTPLAPAIVEGGVHACLVGHDMWTVGARFGVLPRLALGPEVIRNGYYDSWLVLGEAVFDLRRSGRVMPYVRAGAGVTSSQSFPFGRVTTGAFSGGVGVLIPLGDYLFVAPESRLLIEDQSSHPMVGVIVGVRLR